MVPPTATPLPVGATIVPGSLREQLDALRASGKRFTLRDAVGIVVPVAVELAELHAQGATLFVHPSCIRKDASGAWHVDPVLARTPPGLPRDQACMAPEERSGRPGAARASVYAVGAILYELATGHMVGPGMRRPSEIIPHAPAALEAILGKALVSDPAQRPDDLGALAQAIHHLSPAGSIPPPAADESHLEVDVSLSMLPPPTSSPSAAMPSNPYDMGVVNATRTVDSAGELQALKAQLEADKRARYVVAKDGMDHGPFAAVELLQQIANHTFEEHDILRDSLSKDEREIRAWVQFAPFAEHARLHREHKAEKAAIEQVVVEEKKSTRGKALFGIGAVGALVVVGAVWFLTATGAKSDEIAVQSDQVTNIETDGGLKVDPKKRRGGGGVAVSGRSAGGHPVISGGSSCEAAQAAYVEEYKMGGEKVAPDLTAGAYGSVLNRGSYFAHCGVSDNITLNICAAVQNGRAVGVTVSTSPRNAGINGCVSAAVRGLSFPSHPRLDVTRTTFAAQ